MVFKKLKLVISNTVQHKVVKCNIKRTSSVYNVPIIKVHQVGTINMLEKNKKIQK